MTGAEPDLSQIIVPIPVATSNASYNVVVTTQGSGSGPVASIMAYDVSNASKTTTQFTLSSTGPFAAGDIIGFLLVPFT